MFRVKWVISGVISTRVTLIIALLITDLLSPLGLQVPRLVSKCQQRRELLGVGFRGHTKATFQY